MTSPLMRDIGNNVKLRESFFHVSCLLALPSTFLSWILMQHHGIRVNYLLLCNKLLPKIVG